METIDDKFAEKRKEVQKELGERKPDEEPLGGYRIQPLPGERLPEMTFGTEEPVDIVDANKEPIGGYRIQPLPGEKKPTITFGKIR
ncbi:MAG: hypothetical protein PHW96_00640 [Candidatus Nanoarchaeia archaeon]|nr:hypothetical protein [Candidatus Nanoarchaeia archaeon]